jgi:hypothetical protein
MKLSHIIHIIVLAIVVLLQSAAYSQPRKSSIRSFDFANFIYPINSGLKVSGSRRKTFTVRNGEFPETKSAVGMSLVRVAYGDVTGDGDEDAIIEFGVDTNGGTAIIYCVYIYSWRNNHPQYLWSFVSGDRADGGLRQVLAENGDLIVELYGKGARIGGKLYGTEEVGACCPRSVTRTRYQWRGNRFRQKGKSEIFPNPADNGSRIS